PQRSATCSAYGPASNGSSASAKPTAPSRSAPSCTRSQSATPTEPPERRAGAARPGGANDSTPPLTLYLGTCLSLRAGEINILHGGADEAEPDRAGAGDGRGPRPGPPGGRALRQHGRSGGPGCPGGACCRRRHAGAEVGPGRG